MRFWVLKRLRDLRSGKPETDISLFPAEDISAEDMRALVAKRWPEAMPWGCEEDEVPTVWSRGDPRHPDEFIELECHVIDQID